MTPRRLRAAFYTDDALVIVYTTGEVERLDPSGPRNGTSHALTRARP